MSNFTDTIVIGGSAGGFNALKVLLAGLDPDLPAAVLVCLHQSPQAPARTAALLAAHCRLDVETATEGRILLPGRVYVAGPDRHMMIGSDHLHLRRGAHENNFRPAIDPLFRSAAVYRGPRAIGVVLSGLMDDGAAGARAMVRTGGRILVQSPDSAEFPDMPQAALEATPQAECLDLDALAVRLNALAGRPCADAGEVPWRIGLELKIASLEEADMDSESKLGELSPFNCPHCNGVLWEIEDGPLTRYRCHTGHAYTMRSLDAAQEEAVDAGLFNALRAHKGRAELIRRMADRLPGHASRDTLDARAARIMEDAELLERIILMRSQI